MERKDLLQDLYLAVKKHLLKSMSLETAIEVAENVVCSVEQNQIMTSEDIRNMRDTFLKD
ncbi:MAG: hypothetical protein D8G53_04855 [Candidatus Saccharimonas sp.]|nr:MAG: hypothetical protein D8G53_04855 [Candidatus Saccharimonas sp.]